MAEIAIARAPSEACGLLLPVPKYGTPASQVVEIPNRANDHESAYVMIPEDIEVELESWKCQSEDLKKIAVWHSHPGGNIGPSKQDLNTKVDGVAYLVVTLNADSTVTPCWF